MRQTGPFGFADLSNIYNERKKSINNYFATQFLLELQTFASSFFLCVYGPVGKEFHA